MPLSWENKIQAVDIEWETQTLGPANTFVWNCKVNIYYKEHCKNALTREFRA